MAHLQNKVGLKDFFELRVFLRKKLRLLPEIEPLFVLWKNLGHSGEEGFV